MKLYFSTGSFDVFISQRTSSICHHSTIASETVRVFSVGYVAIFLTLYKGPIPGTSIVPTNGFKPKVR